MKRGNTIYIILIIFVLVGAGALAFTYKNQGAPQSDPPQVALDSTNSGSYVDYTPEALDAATTQRRILYFYANWCPTCRPVDQELTKRTSEIPEGVQIIRVNYNDTDTDNAEKALAEQYGITYQHTFVEIDQEGREVQKWNGGGLDEILSRL
jgi:thiol:disulfide interchange protein